LRIQRCESSGKEYLLSEYNRDGDSFRSPWSNSYTPELPDGVLPSSQLRALEVAANAAFDVYRSLYYEGGHSSVYLWDLDDGFAAAILLKKELGPSQELSEASWDAIHVCEVVERPAHKVAHYKLTSTVILSVHNDVASGRGQLEVSGNLTRQTIQDLSIEDDNGHIINLGRMIEDMEFKLRDTLKSVYFEKTKDIANEVRSFKDLIELKKQSNVQNELFSKLAARKKPVS
jgi:capping protein beta